MDKKEKINFEESLPVKPEVKNGSKKREFVNPNPDKKTPDELRRIAEIRHKLCESVSSESPMKGDVVESPNNQEIVVIRNQKIVVEFVSKESIYPAFGYGGGNEVAVREDLSPRVKRFVKSHELYHCIDKAEWGGWIGREIRANIIPGLKDPIGLMATVWASISDIDRIKFYLKRIQNKH
jgi:hypothetical protein